MFYARLPPRAQKVIELFSAISVVALSIIVILLSWPYMMQSYRISEGSPDPGGLPYRFILKAMIPAGFSLLLMQSLAAALRALQPFFGGRGDAGAAREPANAAQ